MYSIMSEGMGKDKSQRVWPITYPTASAVTAMFHQLWVRNQHLPQAVRDTMNISVFREDAKEGINYKLDDLRNVNYGMMRNIVYRLGTK